MALSKIKSDSIDSIDAAKVPNLDASKIATGTVDNARITLDAAEIPDLDAAKITTGDIALARLGNAPATDLTPVKNDISLLALQTAMNGNMSAFGLKNSWIEQFENSTYIANLTNVTRDASEYIGSVSSTTTDFGSGITPTYSITGSWNMTPTHSMLTDADWQTGFITMSSTLGAAFKCDLGASYLFNSGEITIANSRGHGDPRQYTVTYSTDDSTYYSNWDFSGCTNVPISHSGSSSGFSSGTSGGVINLTGHSSNGHWSGIKITGVPTVTARYVNVAMTAADFHDINAGVTGWDYGTVGTETVNATGSFTSTVIVPQDATNKSSMGLVILYKDQAGTTTFNGANQLVAKVRANTGQAYQEVVLAGAGTYSDGLKIAIAPAISVTAGQALSYEINLAGQSASLETRVHGVAMTYQEI